MKKSEMAKVLAFAQGADRRELNELSVDTWHDLLGEMTFEVALRAVKDHYREQSRPVFPADIIARAAEMVEVAPWDVDPAATAAAATFGVSVEEYLERRDEPGFLDSLTRRLEVTRG